MSINKVILVGHCGKQPEVRHLDSGVNVASFSLATSENYTNKKGEKVEQTEWHSIVIWGKLAEVVEKYVTKGQLLYVEGKIKTRSWEKDGQKHYTTEIFADSLQMLSKGEAKAETAPAQAQAQSTNNPEEEFIPF